MIIQCPKCSRDLELKEEMLDKRIRCPLCQEIFTAASGSRPADSQRVKAAADPPPLPSSLTPPVSQSGPLADIDDERPRPRRRPRRNDDYDDRDDYRDDYDYRYRSRAGMVPDRGSLILVLGILGLVACGPVLGPIAWIMGASDLKEMRDGRMDPIGESNTRAGMICGIIASILSILSLLGLACWFLAVMQLMRIH